MIVESGSEEQGRIRVGSYERRGDDVWWIRKLLDGERDVSLSKAFHYFVFSVRILVCVAHSSPKSTRWSPSFGDPTCNIMGSSEIPILEIFGGYAGRASIFDVCQIHGQRTPKDATFRQADVVGRNDASPSLYFGSASSVPNAPITVAKCRRFVIQTPVLLLSRVLFVLALQRFLLR
jgi:hypothetical protein